MQNIDKTLQLDKIAKEIENCKICRIGKSGKAVVGEGSPDAKIAFIGEAPGKKEAKTGRPFVGRSGQLLRALIRESGLKEEDVYITSPVKYLPDCGTPTPEDIKHGKIHLDKQLEVIDPKIIVLLGSVAVQAVLGKKLPVLKEHGKVIEEKGRKYFLTLHPAAALRFAKNKPLLLSDFKNLKSLLDK
ncbi:MAG: uracil-DNA glycosylase [Candidatus Levybacteria bacterium]|nr:uracil-DNA glycosylase [Candidatus Levybacteria bacterium]